MSKIPSQAIAHVRVLMATYNGSPWINEQVDSIADQRGVRVSIVASDDHSSDTTIQQLVVRNSALMPVVVMDRAAHRHGSANGNFLRLICEAPLGDADYVAFSDQDDRWHRDKLRRAVDALQMKALDVYSSDVLACWPDGRRQRLMKAMPQRSSDHLFEAAGPGCTYVFQRHAFDCLRAWAQVHRAALASMPVHDWWIYGHARVQGWRWWIDPEPSMEYRQHDSNEVGANVGWSSALRRWRRIRSGAFRRDVLAIAAAVGAASPARMRLERLSATDRMWLAWHAADFRRRPRERWVLRASFLLMRRSAPGSSG